MDSLLIAENLSCSYGDFPALHPLNLKLETGDVLGLLGPNGAGKSTCLRLLSGTLRPTQGRIRILGLDLVRSPRRAKRHLGYLPERPPLYRNMRVQEYLTYCARLRGLSRAEQREALDRVLLRCQLTEVARYPIWKLSKGYRQRVGIAQAIVHEPALVILDEPTEGLDPLQRQEIAQLIGELACDCGILFSSHVLSEVQAVCQRVLILQNGRVLHESRLSTASEHRYRLGLENPPDLSVLAQLPGVQQIQPCQEAGFFSLEYRSEQPISALAKQIVEQGWGLCELSPARTDLEQLFFRAIAGEIS